MNPQKKLVNATCPECRGPLSEQRPPGGPTELVCLVGHRYSARALLEAHSETQEKALWSAVVALEETSNMARAVSADLAPGIADRLQEQVAQRLREAGIIREILQRLEPFRLD